MIEKVNISHIPVWDDPAPILRSGKLGLLCNQTAWHQETGEYLFETFFRQGNLKRVFIPEHGLFGELQDQVKLEGHDPYGDLEFSGCEFVSLYGSNESSLNAKPEKLIDLDALIIDIQDVGVRYYTYLSTLRNLFITLKKENIALPIWIIDRENPAGLWVEGSPLREGYGSFIGIEGIPHRHGLTFGEMACFLHHDLQVEFPLHIVSHKTVLQYTTLPYTIIPCSTLPCAILPWVIPPSPNIPGFFTCSLYSGQCLWEGTNVSEGRGTTRPFEVFGAPWMGESLMRYNKKAGYENWNEKKHPLYDPGAALRWHRFIPVFHKYKYECCFGFQVIMRNHNSPFDSPKAYHALFHAIKQIRFVRENCEGFAFRPGKYEAGNDKTAIELLAGDPVILDCLHGNGSISNPNDFNELKKYFKYEEEKWIEKTRRFRIYDEPLNSVLLCDG